MASLTLRVARVPRGVVTRLIRFYQLAASPFPSPCRYQPTCSTYVLESVERHGVWKGGWRGVKRLLRCHPFHAGGHDPVA